MIDECMGINLNFDFFTASKEGEIVVVRTQVIKQGKSIVNIKDKCRTDNANGAFQYIAELKRLLDSSKSRTLLKKSKRAALVVPTESNIKAYVFANQFQVLLIIE